MKSHLKKSLKLLDKYMKEIPKEVVDEELEFCKCKCTLTFDEYMSIFRNEVILSFGLPKKLL